MIDRSSRAHLQTTAVVGLGIIALTALVYALFAGVRHHNVALFGPMWLALALLAWWSIRTWPSPRLPAGWRYQASDPGFGLPGLSADLLGDRPRAIVSGVCDGRRVVAFSAVFADPRNQSRRLGAMLRRAFVPVAPGTPAWRVRVDPDGVAVLDGAPGPEVCEAVREHQDVLPEVAIVDGYLMTYLDGLPDADRLVRQVAPALARVAAIAEREQSPS